MIAQSGTSMGIFSVATSNQNSSYLFSHFFLAHQPGHINNAPATIFENVVNL